MRVETRTNVLLAVAAVVGLAASVPVPAYGQVGKGLSGPHWNLNIIGVPKNKTAPMTNGNRHTIFVPLDSGGDVGRTVKIFYERNVANPTEFEVKDGNATDDNEATILVPFEFCEDLQAGCEDLLSFDVYAVGLGKPNGGAIITAECTFSEDVVPPDTTCTDTLLMKSFEIKRTGGKPRRVNITDIFRATGCLDNNDDGVCNTGDLSFNDIWIFNIEELVEYFWDYDNNKLKLMQVRFYATTSGSIVIVP